MDYLYQLKHLSFILRCLSARTAGPCHLPAALNSLYPTTKQSFSFRSCVQLVQCPRTFSLAAEAEYKPEQKKDRVVSSLVRSTKSHSLQAKICGQKCATTTTMAGAGLTSMVPWILHLPKLCQTFSKRSQHDDISRQTTVAWYPVGRLSAKGQFSVYPRL